MKTIDDKNEMIDYNETLLKLEGNRLNNIEEVKEDVDVKNSKVNLDEFVEKNKWKVYKDLVDVFKERTSNDNALKKTYSKILIGILITQLIVMNIIFILKGANVLQFADTTFNIFITATIAEVFTLVTIIVRYLFTDNLTELLKKLLSNESKEEKIDKKN